VQIENVVICITQGDYNQSHNNNNNATAWNSQSTNGALNKPGSVSFQNPPHINAATASIDALGPDVQDSANFRF